MEEKEKVTPETETQEQAAPAEPKVVYTYVVKRYDNGLYDFEGLPLVEGEVPSIDQYHIATDMVELGKKLDRQLLLEEARASAVNEVFGRLTQMAQQQAEAEAEEDPTKA